MYILCPLLLNVTGVQCCVRASELHTTIVRLPKPISRPLFREHQHGRFTFNRTHHRPSRKGQLYPYTSQQKYHENEEVSAGLQKSWAVDTSANILSVHIRIISMLETVYHPRYIWYTRCLENGCARIHHDCCDTMGSVRHKIDMRQPLSQTDRVYYHST